MYHRNYLQEIEAESKKSGSVLSLLVVSVILLAALGWFAWQGLHRTMNTSAQHTASGPEVRAR